MSFSIQRLYAIRFPELKEMNEEFAVFEQTTNIKTMNGSEPITKRVIKIKHDNTDAGIWNRLLKVKEETHGQESMSFPEAWSVQYGLLNITTDDTNSIDVKNIHCNNYTMIYDDDDGYFENFYDIAILELATPLPDDGSWEPVTLARVFDSSAQQDGVIIGWGDTDDEANLTMLEKLNLDVYNDTVCGAATRQHADHHVCVGSKSGYGGACHGDSGTAVLVDGVQVGLTSYLTIRPPVCGYDNSTYPTVYARVPKYYDWIVSITPDVQTK